jgi:hypothetical protein
MEIITNYRPTIKRLVNNSWSEKVVTKEQAEKKIYDFERKSLGAAIVLGRE